MTGRPAGILALAGIIALAAPLSGCGGGGTKDEAPSAPKRFPVPLYEGLALGMTRAEVARVRPIRPALTSSGKNRLVWVGGVPGEWMADLTFTEDGDSARLARIDVHFGRSDATSEEFIARFERLLGAPDVRRRQAVIKAYAGQADEQYETIWSDASQYVFLTERVPVGGKVKPAYFLTVKKKEITATGPPTGYVPPPPPKDKEGKPVDESPF